MKKLIKVGLVVAAVAFVAKMMAAKCAGWQGLTEAEVRDKLDSRLPGKVPPEKRSAIADQVVSKMREKGALADEPEPAPDEPAPDEPGDEEPDSSDAG